MAKLQPYLRNRAAGGRVRLVSITVDPVNDTPERLAAYAAGFQADPALWKFLTGPAREIETAVEHGFKVGVTREPDGQGGFNILHGTRLVLVDARGAIRGYYDVEDAIEMKRLRTDLGTLLERGGS
jgi:protein SCO1/2